MIGKRPLPAPDVFSIMHVPLTTRNVFVTCDTTQRTRFRNNNCGLKNFQRAVRANGFHIKWNRFWKPVSFDQKCGRQQLERSTAGWQTDLFPLRLHLLCLQGNRGSGGQNPTVWPFKMQHIWVLSYNYQVLFSSILQFANILSRVLCLQVIASHYSGVLSPKFIFSCTTIASIFAYVKCIVRYCCSRENETLRQ